MNMRTPKQTAKFEQNQILRDEIFNIIRFDIDCFSEYVGIVENYDHTGTLDERLEKEHSHLQAVLINLQGKQS